MMYQTPSKALFLIFISFQLRITQSREIIVGYQQSQINSTLTTRT